MENIPRWIVGEQHLVRSIDAWVMVNRRICTAKRTIYQQQGISICSGSATMMELFEIQLIKQSPKRIYLRRRHSEAGASKAQHVDIFCSHLFGVLPLMRPLSASR
jgi:hypothetical protein